MLSSGKATFAKTCNCGKEFNVRSTFYKHIKKCKGENDNPEETHDFCNYICKEDKCPYKAKLSADLINHLQSVHGTEVPIHSHSFQKYSGKK